MTKRISGDLVTVKTFLSVRPCVAEISASSPIFRFYHQGVINDIEVIKNNGGSSSLVCSASKINHAVLIVGWGRDHNSDNSGDQNNEYIIVKNNFDKKWGELGYARISVG